MLQTKKSMASILYLTMHLYRPPPQKSEIQTDRKQKNAFPENKGQTKQLFVFLVCKKNFPFNKLSQKNRNLVKSNSQKKYYYLVFFLILC